MSPEVLSNSEYNKKTDIWSLGITAIEMAEGDPPYSHINHMRAMFVIQRKPAQGLTIPEKWSPEFNNFIKRCLTLDQKYRPTAKELLLDPFIMKSKGPALLSELVANSLEEIERYRLKDYNNESNDNNSHRGGGGADDPAASGGTIVEQDGLQTFVNNRGTVLLN
jgi:serine/threonine kinase 4